MVTHLHPSLARVVVLFTLLLGLSACGGGGDGGAAGGGVEDGITRFSAPIPQALTFHHTGGALSAWLQVDDLAPQAMALDRSVTEVSGLLDLGAGSHQFDLAFYLSISGPPVEVARARGDGLRHRGVVTPIGLSDYRFTDRDGDGATNLVELAMGTAVNDPSSFPMVLGRRASGDYLMVDRIGHGPAALHTLVSGPVASNDYEIK